MAAMFEHKIPDHGMPVFVTKNIPQHRKATAQETFNIVVKQFAINLKAARFNTTGPRHLLRITNMGGQLLLTLLKAIDVIPPLGWRACFDAGPASRGWC